MNTDLGHNGEEVHEPWKGNFIRIVLETLIFTEASIQPECNSSIISCANFSVYFRPSYRRAYVEQQLRYF